MKLSGLNGLYELMATYKLFQNSEITLRNKMLALRYNSIYMGFRLNLFRSVQTTALICFEYYNIFCLTGPRLSFFLFLVNCWNFALIHYKEHCPQEVSSFFLRIWKLFQPCRPSGILSCVTELFLICQTWKRKANCLVWRELLYVQAAQFFLQIKVEEVLRVLVTR